MNQLYKHYGAHIVLLYMKSAIAIQYLESKCSLNPRGILDSTVRVAKSASHGVNGSATGHQT